MVFYFSLSRDADKGAVLGGPAPNPVVHNVRKSGERVKLLDLEEIRRDPGRPVVLNFGSCT